MLKPVFDAALTPQKRIADADPGALFPSGLEYNPPARGSRNIVHMAMKVPESHQIYICAAGCLRGVVLTAAEMNAMGRMSWVAVREEDLTSADLEENVYAGTAAVVERLDPKPRAVFVYVSCVHVFAGIDFAWLLDRLRRRFPGIAFVDSYMIPTMRKSGLTPEQLTRRGMYQMLEALPVDETAVNLIGNDVPTHRNSELFWILERAGRRVRDVTECETYDEFLRMGEAALELAYYPPAEEAARALASRLGRRSLYLPFTYEADEIEANASALCEALAMDPVDLTACRERAENALKRAREALDGRPVVIDYMASTRPFSMAKLLLDAGIRVTKLYVDGVSGEDLPQFAYLKEAYPQLLLSPTLDPAMRFRAENASDVVAVGQKAAYFENTPYFVNMVFGNGSFGYEAVEYLADALVEAANAPKDVRRLISHKGMGCESCL